MPGPEYINSIREYPRVYSGINDESADAVELFLETIIDTSICNLTRLDHTNATEMAKVLENSYRATNIAFAVEWSRYAEEAGVDLFSIVNAIRVRSSGTQSETTRASKANMVKSCFTLIENKLAKPGDKTIYLRVLDSDGKLLPGEQSISTNSSKKEVIEMSSKRVINYQNQNTDICVFYEMINEIPAGNYSIELYNEGYLIGSSSFALR